MQSTFPPLQRMSLKSFGVGLEGDHHTFTYIFRAHHKKWGFQRQPNHLGAQAPRETSHWWRNLVKNTNCFGQSVDHTFCSLNPQSINKFRWRYWEEWVKWGVWKWWVVLGKRIRVRGRRRPIYIVLSKWWLFSAIELKEICPRGNNKVIIYFLISW